MVRLAALCHSVGLARTEDEGVVLCEKVRCGPVLVLVVTADYELCLCHPGSMGVVGLTLSHPAHCSRSRIILWLQHSHTATRPHGYTATQNTIHFTSLVMFSL